MGRQKSAMENMVDKSFWEGKVVLLTGHTGFKGSWLSLWLQSMGAEVVGYALAARRNDGVTIAGRYGSIFKSRRIG